jgi:hypothetical protein
MLCWASVRLLQEQHQSPGDAKSIAGFKKAAGRMDAACRCGMPLLKTGREPHHTFLTASL